MFPLGRQHNLVLWSKGKRFVKRFRGKGESRGEAELVVGGPQSGGKPLQKFL